jgi:hypothetical protein
MVGRTIGRFGLLLLAGCLFAASAVTAQTSPSPGPDDLRRKVTEGTEFCRNTLASAPPDIKIGEVEEFCACMGVQEAAMGEMAEAGKVSLRPQLQQMCVGTLRSRQGQGAASPAPAVTPAAPAGSQTPAPIAAPEAASSAAAAATPAVEKIEQWTINTNIAGAPIAYVRAMDAPAVEAFTMYCRAKDAIGLRVKFKSGFGEKEISFPMAGWEIPLVIGSNGLVTQGSWAEFVKTWLDEEKNTRADRKLPDYSGVRDFTVKQRLSGKANLDGLTATRERMRSLCADAIAKGVAAGNYLTTGLAAFDPEVLVGAAPSGTPVGVLAVAPRAPGAEPKPKATPDCAAAFERNYAALRRKELDLAGQTGAVMQTQPRFFWDFCPITRQEIAVAKQILAAANACPSHRNAAGIKSQALAKLAKRQAELQRPRCM